MKSITSPAGTFGGFRNVTTLADAYEADGCIYPFNVLGEPHSIGEWVDPVVTPIIEVPQEVTPRQIRFAMTRTTYQATTLRAAVEAAVAAGSQDIKDWYEFSNVFQRSRPEVDAMGAALGISDTEMDDLWILAATL